MNLNLAEQYIIDRLQADGIEANIHQKLREELDDYSDNELPAVGVNCLTWQQNDDGLLEIAGVCEVVYSGTETDADYAVKALAAAVYGSLKKVRVTGIDNGRFRRINPTTGQVEKHQDDYRFFAFMEIIFSVTYVPDGYFWADTIRWAPASSALDDVATLAQTLSVTEQWKSFEPWDCKISIGKGEMRSLAGNSSSQKLDRSSVEFSVLDGLKPWLDERENMLNADIDIVVICELGYAAVIRNVRMYPQMTLSNGKPLRMYASGTKNSKQLTCQIMV